MWNPASVAAAAAILFASGAGAQTFFGLGHTPLGAATLAEIGEELVIGGIGTGAAADGVAIDVGQTERFSITLGGDQAASAGPDGAQTRIVPRAGFGAIADVAATDLGDQARITGQFFHASSTFRFVAIDVDGVAIIDEAANPIGTSAMSSHMPETVRTWVRADGNVVVELAFEYPPSVSFDGGPESYVSSMQFISEASSPLAPDALSEVRLLFRLGSMRTIVDEAVTMFGYDFRSIGGSTIDPFQGPVKQVVAGALGPGLADGIWMDLGHPVQIAETLFSVDNPTAAEMLHFEARGDVSGIDDQPLMNLLVARNDPFWDITPDVSAVGSSTVRVELYNGGVLQASVSGRSGVVAQSLLRPASVIFETPDDPADAIAAEIVLPTSGPVEIPGLTNVFASRIRIISENHTLQPRFLGGVRVAASDVDAVRIFNPAVVAAPPQPVDIFFGRVHYPLGNATLSQSPSGGLILSNIGSSGEDGVAGEPAAMEEVSLNFVEAEWTFMPLSSQQMSFDVFFEGKNAIRGMDQTTKRRRAACVVEDLQLTMEYEKAATDGEGVYVAVLDSGIYQGGWVVHILPQLEPVTVAQIDIPPEGVGIASVGSMAAGENGRAVYMQYKLERAFVLSYSTGGGSEVSLTGDELLIMPEGDILAGEVITRYELRGRNHGTATLDGKYFVTNVEHVVRGQAVSQPGSIAPFTYQVSNIGSSGLDGAAFTPRPADFLTAVDHIALLLEPTQPLSVGTGTATTQGAFFDLTLSRPGGVEIALLLPAIQQVRESRSIELTADLSALPPGGTTTVIYNSPTSGPVPIPYPNTGPIATIPPVSPTEPAPPLQVIHFHTSCSSPLSDASRRVSARLAFEPVEMIIEDGGSPVLIESIKIVHEGLGLDGFAIESLGIRGTNLDDFVVRTDGTRAFPTNISGLPARPTAAVPILLDVGKRLAGEDNRTAARVELNPDLGGGLEFDIGIAPGSTTTFHAIPYGDFDGTTVMYLDVTESNGDSLGGNLVARGDGLVDVQPLINDVSGFGVQQIRVVSLLDGVVVDAVTHTPPFPAVLATAPFGPAGTIAAEVLSGAVQDSRVTRFEYDAAGRLTSLTGGGPAASADTVMIHWILNQDFAPTSVSIDTRGFNEFVMDDVGILAGGQLEITDDLTIDGPGSARAVGGTAINSGGSYVNVHTLPASGPPTGVEIRNPAGAAGDINVFALGGNDALSIDTVGASARFEGEWVDPALGALSGSVEFRRGGPGNDILIGGATTYDIDLLDADDALLGSYTVIGGGSAQEGGGLWNSSTGTMTITHSTFSGNVAVGGSDAYGRIKVQFHFDVDVTPPGGSEISGVRSMQATFFAEPGSAPQTGDPDRAIIVGRVPNAWSLSTELLSACPCELTGDAPASIDVFDLLAYLDLWFAADLDAERTGDDPPLIDVFDLLAYLDCWFPASAGNACP